MPPNIKQLELSNAQAQLLLLKVALLKRSQAPDLTQGQKDSLALRLSLLDPAITDLGRLINVVDGSDASLPMPSDEALDELDAVADALSKKIASDQKVSALIALGTDVLAKVKELKGGKA